MVEFKLFGKTLHAHVDKQGPNKNRMGYAGEFGEEGQFRLHSSLHIVEISPQDLRVIALKSEEVKLFGIQPQLCSICQGSPFFPNERPAVKGEYDAHVCIHPTHNRKKY